jgi:hypothetical protein
MLYCKISHPSPTHPPLIPHSSPYPFPLPLFRDFSYKKRLMGVMADSLLGGASLHVISFMSRMFIPGNKPLDRRLGEPQIRYECHRLKYCFFIIRNNSNPGE